MVTDHKTEQDILLEDTENILTDLRTLITDKSEKLTREILRLRL